MIPGWRAKVAATLVLFFVGLFGGRLADLMHAVSGKVDQGRQITDQLRNTVTTLRQIDTGPLEAQIADLQARLAAGTATPAQVDSLRGLLARVRAVTGGSGGQGPPGPPGPSGPPGPPATTSPGSGTTTSTTAGGATPTTRPATTSTTRPAPTTTTTRCVAGVGRLLKVGCT